MTNPKSLVFQEENKICLDNSAQALMPVEVREKLCSLIGTVLPKDFYDSMRLKLSRLLHLEKNDLFFVMNTHLAYERLVFFLDFKAPLRVLVDPLSHKAVLNPLQMLQAKKRAHLEFLPLDHEFRLDPDRLLKLLDAQTHAVFINHVSNVDGILQPVLKIQEVIDQFNAKNNTRIFLVVDGSQALPRVDFFPKWPDVYICATQKFFSLPGAFCRISAATRETIQNGCGLHTDIFSEFFIAGTAHLLAIASFVLAMEFVFDLDDGLYSYGFRRNEQIQKLSSVLVNALRANSHTAILGDQERFLKLNTGIISFAIRNHDCVELAKELRSMGILVKGAALDEFSHWFCSPNSLCVYPEMADYGSLLRVSLQWYNDLSDLQTFFAVLNQITKIGLKGE